MTLVTGDALTDFQRWREAFEDYMEFHGREENTLIVYRRIFDKFEVFIFEHESLTTIKNIRGKNIIEFIKKLEREHLAKYPTKKGFAPKTKALYVSILQALFEYITDNCDPDEDTGTFYSFSREFKNLIPKQTKKKRRIKHLSDREMDSVLDYLKGKLEEGGSHYDHIHSLGIKLMMKAGLRVTEMLNIRLEDIVEAKTTDENGVRDFYKILLRETKSGNEQVGLIKKIEIDGELSYFRGILDEEDYVFKGLGSKNKIDRSNFYRTIKKIYQKSGVKRKGLHILRHTSAMKVKEKTKDVLLVKQHLRHASVNTTMIYIDLDEESLASGLR